MGNDVIDTDYGPSASVTILKVVKLQRYARAWILDERINPLAYIKGELVVEHEYFKHPFGFYTADILNMDYVLQFAAAGNFSCLLQSHT